MFVEPYTLPNVVSMYADMYVVPAPMAVTSPVLPAVTTVVSLELQVAELVTSCVLPSVYVPVAVNCWVVPLTIDAFAGFIAMEDTIGGVTVNVAVPATLPEVAVMVVLPGLTLDASPEVLIVAVDAFEEFHVAVEVRSCWLPSLNVPVAKNCCWIPFAI